MLFVFHDGGDGDGDGDAVMVIMTMTSFHILCLIDVQLDISTNILMY